MRRFALAAANVSIAVAIVVEAACMWFAITWFPHAVCALVGSSGLSLRLWLVKASSRRQLYCGIQCAALAIGMCGVTILVYEATLFARRGRDRLQSIYLRSCPAGMVLRATTTIPEADLCSLGVKASGLLRVWPPQQMREVHALIDREYRRMRTSPVFGHVGNVAACGYLPSKSRHFFRYLPQGYTANRKWPLLVFLHGSGGNLGG